VTDGRFSLANILGRQAVLGDRKLESIRCSKLTLMGMATTLLSLEVLMEYETAT